mgnify:FL=1
MLFRSDPFVKQFEQQFQQPFGTSGASTSPTPAVAGQPSPFKAMLEGVTSAAAWVGTEQGGQGGQGMQQAGGTLPAGSSWFVPSGGRPATPAAPSAPVRSTGSAFTSPPQPFPVGAQTPLPLR